MWDRLDVSVCDNLIWVWKGIVEMVWFSFVFGLMLIVLIMFDVGWVMVNEEEVKIEVINKFIEYFEMVEGIDDVKFGEIM